MNPIASQLSFKMRSSRLCVELCPEPHGSFLFCGRFSVCFVFIRTRMYLSAAAHADRQNTRGKC